MKTNAKVSTILKAIENVSNKYSNNILFRKPPHKVGEMQVFTLRTKDANEVGSLIRSDGVRQRKANQDVYNDVMNEIFKLGKPNTVVDSKTIYDLHAEGEVISPEVVEISAPVKRKYTHRSTTINADTVSKIKRKYTKTKAQNLLELNKMLNSIVTFLRYHPNLLPDS